MTPLLEVNFHLFDLAATSDILEYARLDLLKLVVDLLVEPLSGIFTFLRPGKHRGPSNNQREHQARLEGLTPSPTR